MLNQKGTFLRHDEPGTRKRGPRTCAPSKTWPNTDLSNVKWHQAQNAGDVCQAHCPDIGAISSNHPSCSFFRSLSSAGNGHALQTKVHYPRTGRGLCETGDGGSRLPAFPCQRATPPSRVNLVVSSRPTGLCHRRSGNWGSNNLRCSTLQPPYLDRNLHWRGIDRSCWGLCRCFRRSSSHSSSYYRRCC
jgi:hypothetical protein